MLYYFDNESAFHPIIQSMGHTCRVGSVSQADSNNDGGGGQSERERVREQAKQKKKKEEEERSICLRPSSYVVALQAACDQYQGEASTALPGLCALLTYVNFLCSGSGKIFVR